LAHRRRTSCTILKPSGLSGSFLAVSNSSQNFCLAVLGMFFPFSALKIILLNLPLQFSDMETKAQRGEGTHAETQGTVV
jgi:hypothetical protein